MSATPSHQGHLLFELGIALRHFGSARCAAEPGALTAYVDLLCTRRAPGRENLLGGCRIGAVGVWAK
jgi:hypothetical protein